uniref:SID1 transmembrane family member 1 n=1 Tax=Macrostomum lignano TaxID=282301 RepID=A0A1I8H0A6_9PLAT
MALLSGMAARHLLLLLLLEAANAASTAETASFGRVYRSSVGAGVERVFAFTYATPDDCSTGGANAAVRVSVESDEADSEFPLLVVARQQREVISWRLPMSGEYAGFGVVSRTLCPVHRRGSHTVFVEVTSQRPRQIRFSLSATLVPNFRLGLDSPVQVEVSPTQPQYFRFVYPPNVTSVQVRVQSNDALCMRLAVQAAACPANDLARNVEFSGVRQTASRKAVLSIGRGDPAVGTPDRFNVVLLVYPNDANCRGGVEAEVEAASPSASPPAGSGTRQQGRVKRLTLHVQASLHSEQYGWPVLWTLLFYLVLTYQRVLNTSGDEDICFYNFECSHPLGPISSFNSVFSNISYGLLGLLFLLLVWRRDLLQRRRPPGRRTPLQPPLGLPQHHGLHYAMGVALIMQGVMSACYHVCPSYSNFQFDTAFMYMLCGLCALCLYQARHPDSNAPAHAAYLALAIVILTGLLGVFYGGGSVAFYALFCGLLTGASLLLSLRCVGWPRAPARAALLAVANAANLGLGLYGALARPRDFGSFLLWVLTANSLAYFLYYLVMKLRSGERLAKAPLAYLALAGVAWAGAGRFYLQQPANWEDSAAGSRLRNQACVLAGFYDVHDVWHFLSSAAVFFGFMALLTVDDDLETVPRDRI